MLFAFVAGFALVAMSLYPSIGASIIVATELL